MVYGGAPPLATAAFNRRILPFQVEHSRYGQPRGEAWLDPPAKVAEFFAREYPAMTHIETRVTALRTSGYEPLGHFTLPDPDWWADYYTPLEAKLPSLYEKYVGDEAALRLIETTERKINLRRRFGAGYGYAFFVGRSIESRVG
jgi:hypothetical protein